MGTDHSAALCVSRGTCYALLAYEVGLAIDLDRAARQITELTQRPRLKQRRRAPQYFDYQPPPVRVLQETRPLRIGAYSTAEAVDVVLYDFGAISVTYGIPVSGPFSGLIELSELLSDNAELSADALRRVEQLVAAVRPAVTRPRVADFVETYTVFHIEAFTETGGLPNGEACTEPKPVPSRVEGPVLSRVERRSSPPEPTAGPAALYTTHAHTVAQLLRSERAPLSAEEVCDATASHIAYGTDDVCIIDWDGALLFGRESEDVRAVLEFANIQLLEMRYLDHQLDAALDESYAALSQRTWRRVRLFGARRADLQRVAQLQVDNALLFEAVNNALKLLGDQYLARVYRLVLDRFHLSEWDAGILRKLQTLESIYQKMADAAANRRIELLEWIIIILSAASVAVYFVPGLTGH